MDRIFQVVAAIFGGAAAYFYWAGNSDGAFAAAVFAAASFFLNIRFQAKDRLRAEAERRAAEISVDEDPAEDR